MIKLLRYLKQFKKQTILGPIFKLIEALLELAIPFIMAVLIDDGIGKKDTTLIFLLGGAMLVIILTGALCAFLCQYYASIAGQGFGTNLRNACFKKVSSLSYSKLDSYPPSKIMTRMTSDINQVQLGIALTIRLATRIPFLLIFGMIMAMIINLKLGLILLCATPFFCIAAFLIMRKTYPQFRKVQSKLDYINKNVKENLSGQRVIRAFDNQSEETKEFLNHNKNYGKEASKSGVLSSLFGPLSLLILNISVVLIIYLGGIQLNSGETSQGQIVAFINYVFLILQSLVVLSNVMPILVKMVSSSSRVLELLKIPEVQEPNDSKTSDIQSDYSQAIIEFKNAVFNYQSDGENEIKNVSFKIERGQSVGIIGPTGSGKTTLINLLQGFYKLNEGEILIYGVNINNIEDDALQKIFGLVPQKVTLFQDTISNNIKMGCNDASDEEVKLACSIAQADVFIETLENKYQTMLKINGSNLSGGQRQRLTIARAVIRKPQILILDDCSSALDYLTESKLKKAIKKNLANTVINITQRVNSVKDCDVILVLNNGKLEAMGKHSELLKTSKTYNEFYKAQNL